MAKTIVIKQVGSPIRRPKDQRQTLVGLGLNKKWCRARCLTYEIELGASALRGRFLF